MKTKKFRDVMRDANMRNFSTNTIDRYIIIEEESTDEEKNRFVKEINQRLWSCIQEVNALVPGRMLPYVVVRRAILDEKFIRIIINDIDSNSTFEQITKTGVKIEELSHLINFKTLGPQKRIMVSDIAIPANAKMIIDKDDQLSAAVDIYLDIAMFNSFSFLKELTHEQKVNFSSLKYSHFKNINESCYYYISDTCPPAYYSFAFTARTNENTIDYSKYVELWENFTNTYYSDYRNIVPSPSEQLKLHTDVKNIDKMYFDNDYWLRQGKGDFLLLRINKEPHKNSEKAKILNYFGKTEFNVGETTVVPLREYFNPFLRKYINELYISAFKIVSNVT